MDLMLVTITITSLALAVTMSIIAWRLMRAERVRATARMDALRAMASRLDAEAHAESTYHDEANDTYGPPEPSLPFESAYVLDDEPPASAPAARRPASVAPAPTPAMRVNTDAEPAWDVLHTHAASSHHDGPHGASGYHDEMFDSTHAEGAPGRRWLALAAVALLMAAGVATVSALNSPEITAAVAAARAATPVTEQRVVRPLELLSLRHQREPGGTFTIEGLVENPADGQPQSDVVAVVYLFDGGERYFASGRARVDRPVLAPGERSPFVVKIAGGQGVQRYRVGFQRGEDGSIMHVDRRGQGPESTTEAVAGEDAAALAPHDVAPPGSAQGEAVMR